MVSTKPKSKIIVAPVTGGRTKNSSHSTEINNGSSHIQWQVIRNNSVFLKRQKGIQKLFSTERFNVKGINSIRYNGLVNKSAVDIQPSGKSLVVSTKKKSSAAHPAKSVNTTAFTKNSRRSLEAVKGLIEAYKPAHSRAGERRTSQILRSLKPVKRAGVRRHGGTAGKTEA